MILLNKDYTDLIPLNSRASSLIKYLFLLSFVLIPIDDLPYLESLGVIGKRASIFPFVILIPITLFLILKYKKLHINLSLEKIFLYLFYSWAIFSTLLNINNILLSTYKGASGINKALIHLVSLTLVMLICYCSEFLITNTKISLKNIRTAIAFSFIPVSIVGLIELVNILGIVDFSSVLENITYTFNTAMRGYVYGGRVRGISAEASYMGMYCAFILPWFISYLYTEKNKKSKLFYSVVILLIIGLVVGTKSRTATILVLFEIISLFLCTILFYRDIKIKIISFIIVLMVTLPLFLLPSIYTATSNYINNLKNPVAEDTQIDTESGSNYSVNNIVSSIGDSSNLSNIARSSMQKAAVGIALEHPFTGVGIGQFGFNFKNFVPEESLVSNEVKIWLDDNSPTWPPVHSLYHRLASETGFIGLLLFVLFVFFTCLKLLLNIIKNKYDIWGILLLISYSSIAISSLTIDTFLLIQFWLLTPIIFLYSENKIKIS